MVVRPGSGHSLPVPGCRGAKSPRVSFDNVHQPAMGAGQIGSEQGDISIAPELVVAVEPTFRATQRAQCCLINMQNDIVEPPFVDGSGSLQDSPNLRPRYRSCHAAFVENTFRTDDDRRTVQACKPDQIEKEHAGENAEKNHRKKNRKKTMCALRSRFLPYGDRHKSCNACRDCPERQIIECLARGIMDFRCSGRFNDVWRR